MVELALFPLNTVLFPGMPLKLHIFEERYKQMINHCIDTQMPFGVVLIEEGEEALGPIAQPHRIGTTAHINQVQRLPFGRMNIVALGRERFRVLDFNHDMPYLRAQVEYLHYTDDTPDLIEAPRNTLRPLVERYLTVLEKAGQVQFDSNQIPLDPLPLANLAAIILQTENSHKQSLLEVELASDYMHQLTKHYRREVSLLEVLLSPPNSDEPNEAPFSSN